jgi:hypothetical protein
MAKKCQTRRPGRRLCGLRVKKHLLNTKYILEKRTAAVSKSMTEASEAEIAQRRKQAAERALAEAEQRRRSETITPLPKESGNRKGPEPTRYGDWEKKGILSDF